MFFKKKLSGFLAHSFDLHLQMCKRQADCFFLKCRMFILTKSTEKRKWKQTLLLLARWISRVLFTKPWVFINQLRFKSTFQLWNFLFKPNLLGETGIALHRIVSVATESIVPSWIALYNCQKCFQVSKPIWTSRVVMVTVLLRKIRAQGIRSWHKAELGSDPRADSYGYALLMSPLPKPQGSFKPQHPLLGSWFFL